MSFRKSNSDRTSVDLQTMSWSDMFFNLLIDLYNLRTKSDEEFNRGVNSLSIIAEGFKDAEYKNKMLEVEQKVTILEKEDKPSQQIFNWHQEEKAKQLSRLIYRAMKGSTPVVEYDNHGRIVNSICKKLITQTGVNIYFTGKTGSGKSESAISLASHIVEQTGGEFQQETHIVFSPSDFAKLYNDEKLTPPGSVIIYDEAGVNSYSRDALRKSNKNFNKIFQIIRHRSIAVILTAPDLSMLDVGLRKLLHYWFETNKLAKDRGLCHVKPHLVSINQMSGKLFYPYPIYDGFQIRDLRFEKIRNKDLEVYHRLAKEFKDNVAKQLEIELSESRTGSSESKEPVFSAEELEDIKNLTKASNVNEEERKVDEESDDDFERSFQEFLAKSKAKKR